MDLKVKRKRNVEEKLEHYVTSCDDQGAVLTEERYDCILFEVRPALLLLKRGELLPSKQCGRLKIF